MDPDLERARKWLDAHRLANVSPTPLLAARLRARRLGRRAEIIAFMIAFLGPVVFSMTDNYGRPPVGPNTADSTAVDWSVLANLALVVGLVVGIWRQRRVERKLLAGMKVRSAHASATGVTKVLGGHRLRAAIVVYGGALALGAIVAVSTTDTDQELGVTFLVGVALLAVLGWLTLTAALRRPALATDEGSLLVDDVLRAEDARRAIAPYPLIVALVAGVASTVGSWVIWGFLGYTAVGFVAWVLGERMGSRVEVGR